MPTVCSMFDVQCSSNGVSTYIDRSPNNGRIGYLTILYISNFTPFLLEKNWRHKKKYDSTHDTIPRSFHVFRNDPIITPTLLFFATSDFFLATFQQNITRLLNFASHCQEQSRVISHFFTSPTIFSYNRIAWHPNGLGLHWLT